MIKTKKLEEALLKSSSPFIQVMHEADWRNGWKISIQGKTIQDTVQLVSLLYPLLESTQASFKIGTQTLIDCNVKEQSTKLMTIYIPNGVDPKSYAELVRLNLDGKYFGYENIPDKIGYVKYSEGIFYRNDRDENGNYVFPDGTKS